MTQQNSQDSILSGWLRARVYATASLSFPDLYKLMVGKKVPKYAFREIKLSRTTWRQMLVTSALGIFGGILIIWQFFNLMPPENATINPAALAGLVVIIIMLFAVSLVWPVYFLLGRMRSSMVDAERHKEEAWGKQISNYIKLDVVSKARFLFDNTPKRNSLAGQISPHILSAIESAGDTILWHEHSTIEYEIIRGSGSAGYTFSGTTVNWPGTGTSTQSGSISRGGTISSKKYKYNANLVFTIHGIFISGVSFGTNLIKYSDIELQYNENVWKNIEIIFRDIHNTEIEIRESENFNTMLKRIDDANLQSLDYKEAFTADIPAAGTVVSFSVRDAARIQAAMQFAKLNS